MFSIPKRLQNVSIKGFYPPGSVDRAEKTQQDTQREHLSNLLKILSPVFPDRFVNF